MKGMWVGYDVGCTMGLTCGHGAWQIDRQSNGSMWNSYSFQPVGQWMSYSFTDLGAEGCCRSLNALLVNQSSFICLPNLKHQRQPRQLYADWPLFTWGSQAEPWTIDYLNPLALLVVYLLQPCQWWHFIFTWRRYDTEKFPPLRALCEGNPLIAHAFPS